MYNALGYGKGDSILAAIAIVIGCPAYVHHLPRWFSRRTYAFRQSVAILDVR